MWESEASVTLFIELDHCAERVVCQRWPWVCHSISFCICISSSKKTWIVRLRFFCMISGIHFSSHMMNSSLRGRVLSTCGLISWSFLNSVLWAGEWAHSAWVESNWSQSLRRRKHPAYIDIDYLWKDKQALLIWIAWGEENWVVGIKALWWDEEGSRNSVEECYKRWGMSWALKGQQVKEDN